MPPKVDWPAAHDTDNNIATRNSIAFSAFARSPPILLCAIRTRIEMREKYKDADKEVVSDFTKEFMASMGFLNRSERIGNPRWLVSAC